MLGGFWAYKVLGWGGYWGWDPVENASLIPWIVIAALLHGLLVQRASGALRRTNLVLALAAYLLVLYSTFLTRSGVLAEFSVHSFPAGSIYRILLGIMFLALAVSVFVFVRAKVPFGKEVPLTLAWPLILSTVIVLLTISAAFVLIGTSWPILSSLAGKAASFGAAFYNSVNLPLYIALLLILGVAPFVGWATPDRSRLISRVLPALVLAGGGTATAFAFGGRGLGALLLFFVSLFAAFANLFRFVEVGRVRLLHGGAAVAHLGFALMFIGIVASGAWGAETEVRLPRGQPVEALGLQLTFSGHVDGSEPQDRWRIIVSRPDGVEVPAEVHMFRVAGGRGGEEFFHRPAILRGLAGDLYIAPQGLEIDGGRWPLELARGEPLQLPDTVITFERFETAGMGTGQGMTVLAHLRVQRGDAEERVALPFEVGQSGARGRPVEIGLMPGLTFTLDQMSVEAGRILVLVEDPAAEPAQILSAEVSTKPLINLLWLGTLLLGVGCSMAILRRITE